MATQVRSLLQSQVAVSITGIAEAAKDASDSEQPQAWIGFADAKGSTSMHIRLFRDRKVNIQFATQAALVWALKCVRER
jgi:nicotinamide mononucleotide (NMN) deamidase PncC